VVDFGEEEDGGGFERVGGGECELQVEEAFGVGCGGCALEVDGPEVEVGFGGEGYGAAWDGGFLEGC